MVVSARWIRSHRISLAAYRLSVATDDRDVRRKCNELIREEVKQGSDDFPDFVKGLPIGTLRALRRVRRLLRHENRWISESAAETLWRVDPSRPDRRYPLGFNGVLSVVYHVLYQQTDPIMVPRLAQSVLSSRPSRFDQSIEPVQKWSSLNNADTAQAIAPHLEVIRTSSSPTERRLAAIGGLREAFGNAELWDHCENCLYHLSFAWPLLVLTDTNVEDGKAGAVTLPIGVDVNFQRGADSPEVLPLVDDGEVLDISEWRRTLKTVVQKSKVILTEGGRKHHEHFCDRINRSQVVFDFRYAERVAVGFKIPLSDRSMETYFSQAVIARMIGRTPSLGGVATGQIGKRLSEARTNPLSQQIVDNVTVVSRNRKLPDFELEWPGRPLDKMTRAFNDQYFEILAYPNLAQLKIDERSALQKFITEKSRAQTASIVCCAHLSNVTDCLQQHRWRTTTYIRCPDIGWRVHGPDTFGVSDSGSSEALPGAHSRNVRWCRQALRRNASTLFEVPENVSPYDIASALCSIEKERSGISAYKRGQILHHRLSWMFVRATENESGPRFWHVLWSALGADRAAFEEFHLSGIPEQAAKKLARVINEFSGDDVAALPAPDIIVIMNAGQLSEGIDRAQNPAAHPCDFDSVLTALATELRPVPAPRLRQLIGRTRVIILRHDTRIPSRPLDVNPGLRVALDCLSTFRFAFTQQMASVMLSELELSKRKVREVLDELERVDLVRRFAGEYHIPELPSRLIDLRDKRRLPQRHFAAGMAMAPYLSSKSLAGMHLSRAMLPESVNEAEFHITKALYYAMRTNQDDGLRSQIRAAQHRLQRFFVLPGWHAVADLSKGTENAKDAYDLGQRLLAKTNEHGNLPHPSRILSVAVAGRKRLQDLQKSGHTNLASKVDAEIRLLYEMARSACDAFPRDEEEYNRLSVMAGESLYLEALGSPRDRETGNSLNREVWELLKRRVNPPNGSAVLGEWYERRGDEQISDLDAEPYYAHGVEWQPKWCQLWIKLCGVLTDWQRVKTILRQLSIEARHSNDPIPDVGSVLIKSARAYWEQRECVILRTRWDNGIAGFRRFFARNSQVQKLLYDKFSSRPPEVKSWKRK